MKRLLLLLLLIPATAIAQDNFQTERVCLGSGDRNAMVLESDGRYFVVKTFEYSPRPDDAIVRLEGAYMGGNTFMTVFRNGTNKSVDVQVLSRTQYGYSGYMGASMLCKKISLGEI